MSRPEKLTAQNVDLRKVLIRSQSVFFGLLALCVLVNHSHAAQNDGISFYAVHRSTLAFAIVGYLTAAVGLWRVAVELRLIGHNPLATLGLRLVAIELILLLITPYSGGAFLNWAHMSVGVSGALIQLALGAWLYRQLRTRTALWAVLITLSGGVISAFALPDWSFNPLLQGELIFELGFAWALVQWISARSLLVYEQSDESSARRAT